MRHYRGEEAGAFYHKDFQKDRMDLVEQMSCHKAEPPKAPVAKKNQPPAEPAAPVEAAPKVVQRLSTPQQSPMPQPPKVVAQLQRQQQQLKVPLPEMQPRPQFDAAERLNAAIELEVTRRLKERIQAAAISRHALAMMQPIAPPTLRAPQSLQWSSPASLQAHLLRMQQQKQQLSLEASCLAFGSYPLMRDNQGLEKLPPTNIQGAKTA